MHRPKKWIFSARIFQTVEMSIRAREVFINFGPVNLGNNQLSAILLGGLLSFLGETHVG
jgi:hypothetical protein